MRKLVRLLTATACKSADVVQTVCCCFFEYALRICIKFMGKGWFNVFIHSISCFLKFKLSFLAFLWVQVCCILFHAQPLIDLSVIPLDSSTVFMTSSLSADHNATIPLDAAIPNHSPPPSTNRSGAVPMDSTHHMEWASNGQAGFVLPDLSLLHSQLTVFHGSVSNLVQQYATLVSSCLLPNSRFRPWKVHAIRYLPSTLFRWS